MLPHKIHKCTRSWYSFVRNLKNSVLNFEFCNKPLILSFFILTMTLLNENEGQNDVRLI